MSPRRSPFTLALTTALLLAPAAWAAAPAAPYQFDVAVAPGDDAGLKADADLKAQFPVLQTSLQFALEANPNLVRTDPLALTPPASASRESLGLNAAWVGSSAARLDLQVAEKLDQAWAAPALVTPGGHQVDTDDLSARLDLIVTPLKAIDLTVGGGVNQRSILDTALAQAAAPESQRLFATATQDAHAGLKWRPVSWLRFDAGGKLEMADAEWRGPSTSGGPTGAGLAYAFIEPSVDGAVTLPSKGLLDLSLARAVSPIDAGAFSAYAATEDRASAAHFGPNREWRYRMSLEQRLAMLKLSAAVTEAHIESATELGPVAAGVQAPVSVTGGERQQLDLNLSAPLAALGLPSLTLTSNGTWRNSRLRDPFTGEMRRASAESPQMARIDLVQSLAGLRARWGLEGQFGGDLDLYQMSQVSHVSVDDSLGGFIEYSPGAFAVRLQVDGLYGGDRQTTDTIYAGSRAAGFIERIDHHVDDGQAVRLVLKKSL